MNQKKSNFTSSLGFILAAAGSAVGLGNIWRFPYLAASGGGGLFLIIYLILSVTFGYTLLATDLAIGRKTGKSSLDAFSDVNPKWKFLGWLTFIVPCIILTYYCVIGGWILKYITIYPMGEGAKAAGDGYFSSFITSDFAPIVFMLIFMALTAIVVYNGVEKGVERFSKIVMPGLVVMILGIALFSLTLEHKDESGAVRTGLDGLKIYLIPRFDGLTFNKFMNILLNATGQLFYSLSIAMGIMITYGSYVKKDEDLGKSISRIEIFDTGVAFLAGLMIIPSVYVFLGTEGLEKSGPGLIFQALPQIFDKMGFAGSVIAVIFFIMVTFAALTSSVSIMETIVASVMEKTGKSRKQVSLIIAVAATIGSVVVCLGYNILYFELTLPNGTIGQLLDVADYVSNNLIMPLIALCTSLLIGWVVKPKWIIDELEASGHTFKRKILYTVVIKYVVPVVMIVLLLQAIGIF
ncbi:MAG: sodium-dependent transporter [Clostridia bacterium]|nr:sodium-dependent transporter [Clostridia bacterium]